MSLDDHIRNKIHSAIFFDDQRDYWWNQDFLDLMGRRLRLDQAQTILDVGCGMGHWGRALAPILSRHAQVIGVDREPIWLEEAKTRTAAGNLHDRFRFQLGLAERLPFPDDSFDLVTCQTVLIHTRDPKAVLVEMMRVARPGGLLLVVEPNNLSQNLVFSDREFAKFVADGQSVDDVLECIRFDLIVERGRCAHGVGFNSIGDLVPGYFSELALADIRTYLSDKSFALYSTYSTPLQRAVVKHYVDHVDRQHLLWDKETTLSYFLAGGGKADEFDSLWDRSLRKLLDFVDDLKHNAIQYGGGTIMYLVSGRKPEMTCQADCKCRRSETRALNVPAV
jgi:ubiquinone/menaquinone biosynthesis C-methylase UbiE